MGPVDRELLEACRRGDPAARERFVRTYQGLVRWAAEKTLRGAGSSRLELDDLQQDVFRKVFEPGALDALRDPDALKGWILVVTCRLTLDARRTENNRRGREIEVSEAAEDDDRSVSSQEAADESPGPADQAARAEIRGMVAELIEKLPPRERACIRFYYDDQLTHTKIGEILGLPAETVGTILRRCREKLRAALERRGYEKS